MTKDHPREPNDDSVNPSASPGDAASPEPEAPLPDSEEIPKPITVEGTDSESNAPTATAPINPFGFGRKGSTPFSGIIPTFGDANAAVGNRPFDAKQVLSAAAENAQENDENATLSKLPPRKLTGRARSFLAPAPSVEESPPAQQTRKVAFGANASPFASGSNNGAKSNPFGVSVSFDDDKGNKKSVFESHVTNPQVGVDDGIPVSSNPFVTASTASNPSPFAPSGETLSNPSTSMPSVFGDATNVAKSSPFGSIFGKSTGESLSNPKSSIFGDAPAVKKSSPFTSSASTSKLHTEETVSNAKTPFAAPIAPPTNEPTSKPVASYVAPIAPPKSILKKNYKQLPASSISPFSKPVESNQPDSPKKAIKSSPFATMTAKSETKSPLFDNPTESKAKPAAFGNTSTSSLTDKSSPSTSFGGGFISSPFTKTSPFSAGQFEMKSSSPFAASTPFGTSSANQSESKPLGSTPFGSASGFGSLSSQSKNAAGFATVASFGSEKNYPFGTSPASTEPKKTGKVESPFISTTPFTSTATAVVDAKKPVNSAAPAKSTTSTGVDSSSKSDLPTVPKLFSGKTPNFGSSSLGSSSSPKVTTPLFGTALFTTKPVVFSKRPTFQSTLSPNASAFVPGAAAHEKSTRPVPFGKTSSENMVESTQTMKSLVDKPTVKPSSIESTPMDTTKATRKEEKKEWSHTFTDINLMTFKPSITDAKKGSLEKQDGLYKIEVGKYANNSTPQLEVVRIDKEKEEKFLSWEIGGDVLKVARIKKHQNHAALTRIGRAVPKQPCENNPVKIFAMFATIDDCTKFMGALSEALTQSVEQQQESAPASLSVEPILKSQSNAPIVKPKPDVPVAKRQMKPTEVAKVKNGEKKEMDVEKKESGANAAAPSRKADKKKALLEQKKALLERMKKKKPTEVSTPESVADKDKTPNRGFNPAAKVGDASPKVELSTILGTKRSAKIVLETEATKKQKVTEIEKKQKVVEPMKKQKIPEQVVKRKNSEDEVQRLKKQLSAMNEKLEKERMKSTRIERTLVEFEEKTKKLKETEKKGDNMKYELAGLSEELTKMANGNDNREECVFPYRPESKEDFFKRLWTFKPSTWLMFSEVGIVDPVECAIRGWYNSGVNRISSSNGEVVAINEMKYFNVKECDEEVKRVRNAILGDGFALDSPWRKQSCPEEFRTAEVSGKLVTKQRLYGIVLITCNWCKRCTAVSEDKMVNSISSLKPERYSHCPLLGKRS